MRKHVGSSPREVSLSWAPKISSQVQRAVSSHVHRKSPVCLRAGDSRKSFFGGCSVQLEDKTNNKTNHFGYHIWHYLPDMTKVEEISVPPQKNEGGCVRVYINATIHGKSPRENPCPRTINPEGPFETPQSSAFLSSRCDSVDDAPVTIAIMKITAEIILISVSILWVTSSALSRVSCQWYFCTQIVLTDLGQLSVFD